MTDRQETTRRVEALKARLNHLVDQFHEGHPVDVAEYQNILNRLCKTLLQLEYADVSAAQSSHRPASRESPWPRRC